MSTADDLIASLSSKIVDYVSQAVNDHTPEMGQDDLMTLLEDINEGIKAVFDSALELIKEREAEEEDEEEDEDAEED